MVGALSIVNLWRLDHDADRGDAGSLYHSVHNWSNVPYRCRINSQKRL